MYQTIMVPVDGSELAECVLPHVETLAKSRGVKNVVFVRAVEPFEFASVRGEPDFTEEQIEEIDARGASAAREYLDKLVNRVDYGTVKVDSAIVTGRTAHSLADYAHKNAVDMIVIATHGRSGVGRWVWGSVADRLLHASGVPVLMVRALGCGLGA
jgi:nucleotide-binding universal stress UspA family protein